MNGDGLMQIKLLLILHCRDQFNLMSCFNIVFNVFIIFSWLAAYNEPTNKGTTVCSWGIGLCHAGWRYSSIGMDDWYGNSTQGCSCEHV